MTEADDPVLSGFGTMDETYVGSQPRPQNSSENDSDDDETCSGSGGSRRNGYGTSKPVVLTTVRGGSAVHARPIKSRRTDTSAPAWRGRLDPMARPRTDALPVYCRLVGVHSSHYPVNHSSGEHARTDAEREPGVLLHTAEKYHAPLQIMVAHVHHWISGKHLDRYGADATLAWDQTARDAGTLMTVLARPAEPLPFAHPTAREPTVRTVTA